MKLSTLWSAYLEARARKESLKSRSYLSTGQSAEHSRLVQECDKMEKEIGRRIQRLEQGNNE